MISTLQYADSIRTVQVTHVTPPDECNWLESSSVQMAIFFPTLSCYVLFGPLYFITKVHLKSVSHQYPLSSIVLSHGARTVNEFIKKKKNLTNK
jgi:subtilase family serine protease